MTTAVAAIDLGATSGRVIVGHVGPDVLNTSQMARFHNGPLALPDGLHWSTQELFRQALVGLRAAVTWEPQIASLGVDSWAVDYALLRGARVLGEPYHYRDTRTAAGVEHTHARVPFDDLYARNGLQFLPFNTLYQLAAEHAGGALDLADSMLLIPDLLSFYLTGTKVSERTNASTTGLVNVSTREWDTELMARLELQAEMFPGLVDPGHIIGAPLPKITASTGLSADVRVTAVGSHDTASAVVGIPLTSSQSAYISCGTWGLVGVELEQPVVTAQAREANFTNEGGVDGRTRFLHNVMGLWLLNESLAQWERDAGTVDLERLLNEAGAVTADIAVFDTNDPRFLEPGDMPARIAEWCVEHDQPVPRSPAETTRSIIESLAEAFAVAVRKAADLSSTRVDQIHIVGGGALNELLCQRTADRSNLDVVAGPVEATALGNVLVQGRALGAIGGSLESMRDLVRRTCELRVYRPRGT